MDPKTAHVQHDQVVTIAVGASRKETNWKNREMPWSSLVEKMSQTTRTRETVAEYRSLSKPKQDDIKDVGGFIGGTLRGGRRKADAVVWRQVITLDADYVTGEFWSAVEILFGYCCAAYSTHKHTPEAPRVRLVIPVSRPVSPEEYAAVARRIAADIGIDMFDDTTYEPHRLMYWPSTPADGQFMFEYCDESWADPDDYLARYEDWADPAQWPESQRQQQSRKRLADKQGDPLEKKGVIGAFCRAYNITDAIEAFLPEAYNQVSEGRYTYTGGTTSGGLVIYDEERFCYSHHGTDPISGQLVNAFDLVRIHKFGEQDDDVEEGTSASKHPSYKAMQALALDDDKVKVEMVQEHMQDTQTDFDGIDDEGAEDRAWMTELSFTEKGDIEKTIPNFELVLRHDTGLVGIAHNEFKEMPVLLEDPPWRERNDQHGPNWRDADDAALRSHLERTYGMYSPSKTHDAVSNIARERGFHPVRQYLDGLPAWDGIDRVERLLVDKLGAEDNILVRAFTRKTLVAAISRVMQPGTKFDTMLVLIGPQGCGKSTLFAKLAKQWFSDSLLLSDMRDKSAVEKLQGYWVIEIGELAGLRKTEEETIKNFLSRRHDVCRLAYDRRTAEMARQCILVGSTNRMQGFLRDTTGNRRFWPVYVDKVPFEQSSWSMTAHEVDQVWAEALEMYHDKEPLHLSPEEDALAIEAQKDAMEEDSRVAMVEDWLDELVPVDWYDRSAQARKDFYGTDFEERAKLSAGIQRGRVCAAEIWCECFGHNRRDLGKREAMDIHSILDQVQGWGRYPGKLVVPGYGQQRVHERHKTG